MRYLFLHQFYWPDLAAATQLLTDLTRELSARGHEVTVICGRSGNAGADRSERPAVEIIHVPEAPFARGRLARVLSSVTFLAAAFARGLFARRPDVVVSLTAPPLLSTFGSWLAAIRGARHFIWEMDMYPDVAVDVGLLARGSLLARITGTLADRARRGATAVIALGDCMKGRLLARGIPPGKIVIAPNWADGGLYADAAPIPEGPLGVIYPGNLGAAHDVRTIAAAMAALQGDEGFVFTFVGGGSRRGELQSFCREHDLAQARFIGYCTPRELAAGPLGEASIGLATQNPACLGTVVPSKIFPLMAAGRPVLFIGPRESTAALIIEKFGCGWRIDAGHCEALVALLKKLAADRCEVRAAGKRAREAFLAHFDRPGGVARICAILGAHPLRERVGRTAGESSQARAGILAG
jgi:glycosyltransferase involved in cell wall biosynthesis